MEDDNNQDAFNELFGALGIDKSKSMNVNAAEVHSAFEECDAMYRSEHLKMGLPITLGVINKANKILVAFGSDSPFTLNKDEALYMITALGALITKSIQEQFGSSIPELEKETKAVAKEIKFKKGGKPAGDSEELKKQIDSHEDEIDASEAMKEIQDNIQEIESIAEQVEEYTKSMTPEEKEQYEKDLAKKKEDLLAKKAREFERQLLGSIEEEESITYNYDYFKKVHEQSGPAALKEELAKLPKEERQEIIDKIIAEAKLKKQQKPHNNNEENS